jgi:hypothetical protein
MLCRRCSGLDSTPQPGQGETRAPAIPRVLPVVSCERCGAVLGPDDLTAERVAVLAELNRFGLTGREGLLKAAPPEPKGL